MSGSPLRKFVLTPAIISASLFAALSLPLTLLGNKPLTIQVQQEPVFYGKLRDVATPYLGLTGAFSLAAGIASVAIAGWRQSSRKSEEVEAQLSGLAQHLKEKEAQLQALKLSEPRLEAAGLTAFLHEEVCAVTEVPEVALESQKPTLVTISGLPPVVEELVIPPQPWNAQEVAVPSITVQAAAAKFACAQTFLGYAQGKVSTKATTTTSEQTNKEVEHLQAQLKQLMAQMASMQASIAAIEAVKLETSVSVNEEPPKVVKSWSVYEMAS